MSPRTKLLFIVVLFSIPTLASFLTFFLASAPGKTSNHGQLITPAVPLPPFTLPIVDGGDLTQTAREQGLRGKWLIVSVARGACGARCEQDAYALRQARLILGREMDRVARLVLIDGDGLPAESVRGAYAGTAWALRPPLAWKAVAEEGAGSIYLVDPLGNAFLRYGDKPDIKGIAEDLKQVLKASQIG